MTAGATAGDVTSHGQAIFKLMMLGVPAVMILTGAFIFFKKVKLDEKMHAQIVDELEKTWSKHLETDETPAEIETNSEVTIYHSPVAGKLISLDEVADKTFASGSMGKGFAIQPTDSRVLAPFKGDHVKQGEELIEFWQPAIKKAGLDDTVMVVITNKEMPEFEYLKDMGNLVQDNENVLKLSNAKLSD